jgi:GPH family glycoside/pentoside/hexuronide:cation symporter
MSASAQPDRPPLSAGLLAGYGLGQVGGQIYRDMPALLLLFYMTNTLGIPGVMAGTAILIPKLWVVICDPLVGAISDRTETRWGRRRPFLVGGAISCSLALIALFAAPVFGSPLASAAYITVMFTIASTAFSLFSVPYLTMASEMTEDTHERSRIMAYRMIFAAVGLTVGAGASQPLVAWLGTGRGGYLGMATIFAVICFLTMMGTVVFTRRIPLAQARSEPISLLAQVKIALRNRPFVVVTTAFLVFQLGQAAGYGALPFLFHYVVQNDALILPFIFIMGVLTVLSAPVWAKVSRRIGKVRTYVISTLGWALVTATWPWAGAGGDSVLFASSLTGALTDRDALVLLRGALIGLINTGLLVMGLSMLSDAIDAERMKSGQNREGVFSGLWSAVEKVSFAGGPFIGGAVLSAMGFVESSTGPVAQTSRAISGIFIDLAWIPIGGALISILIIRHFRIDETAVATL